MAARKHNFQPSSLFKFNKWCRQTGGQVLSCWGLCECRSHVELGTSQEGWHHLTLTTACAHMRKGESASLTWRTHTPNPNSHIKLKLKPAPSAVLVRQYLNFLNSHLMKKSRFLVSALVSVSALHWKYIHKQWSDLPKARQGVINKTDKNFLLLDLCSIF